MHLLDQASARAYRSLLPTRSAARLERAGADGTVLAIGEEVLGQPAGVALARVADGNAHLDSISVAAPYRRQGRGGALLDALEAELGRRGSSRITAVFSGGRPSTPAVEKILERRAWSVPVHLSTVYRSVGSDAERFAQAIWEDVPAPFRIVTWPELAPSQTANVQARVAGDPAFDAAVWPLDRDDWDIATSIALLDGAGEVAGWMLNRQLQPGTLLFDRLWIDPALRRQTLAAPIVLDSIRRGWQAYGSHDYTVIWNTVASNAPMMAFNRGRMAQYVTSATSTFQSSKNLNPRSSAL